MGNMVYRVYIINRKTKPTYQGARCYKESAGSVSGGSSQGCCSTEPVKAGTKEPKS